MSASERPTSATLSGAFSRDLPEVYRLSSDPPSSARRSGSTQEPNKSVGIDMIIDPDRRLFEVKTDGMFEAAFSVRNSRTCFFLLRVFC
jgi:hypothetical protein